MFSQQSSCTGATCECYQRGLADARRTVEAELAAERAAIAILASSLADAAGDISLLVNPQDVQCFAESEDLPIEIDPTIARGYVRMSNKRGATPRAF